MARETVRVVGAGALREALLRMNREAPSELRKTNTRIAQFVRPGAIRRAPKGPHQGGGRIVPITQSITATVSADGGKVTLQAGGARTPHALPIEFGGTIPRRGFKKKGRWAKRFAKSYGAKTITRIAKRSYIYATIDADLPAIFKMYEQLVERACARFGEA